MAKKQRLSNPITIKLNRESGTIQLQWDRKSANINYILNNLKLFNLEQTPKITKQIFSLSTIGGKKANTDTIYI